MHYILKISLGLIMYLTISSCVPDGPTAQDQLDIVYTNFNPNFDFSSVSTFAIPDNVLLLDEETVNNPPQGEMPPTADFLVSRAILDGIRTNMRNRGFTQVSRFDNPDIVLLPTITVGNRIFIDYDWWLWGWWLPNFSPEWGWDFPGYFPNSITSVETGTVLIQMAFPKRIGADNKIPVHWLTAINGVVSGSTGDNTNRISRGINQAFEQSPQIRR